MSLTFECTPDFKLESKDGDTKQIAGELQIHLNTEGAELLYSYLKDMLEPASKPFHYHLNTPEWGGDDLEGSPAGKENVAINQVTLFYWPQTL